jgi:hypothetical protein
MAQIETKIDKQWVCYSITPLNRLFRVRVEAGCPRARGLRIQPESRRLVRAHTVRLTAQVALGGGI